MSGRSTRNGPIGGAIPDGDQAACWLVWNFVTGAAVVAGPARETRSLSRLVSRYVGVLVLVLVGRMVVGDVLGQYDETGTVDVTAAVQLGAAARPLWACVAAGMFLAGYLGAAWAEGREHRRQWVEPAAEVLRPILGWPEGTRASRFLEVPRDFAAAPGGVRVRIPRGTVLLGQKKADVVAACRAKLPLGSVPAEADAPGGTNGGVRWATKGRQNWVVFREVVETMPAFVAYADPDVRRVVDRAEAGKPVIGMKANNVPFRIDFADETPHCLFSAGTGAGKSSGVKAVCAQEMHFGATVIILDLKRRSQRWATHMVHGKRQAIPGVIYCRSIEHMHAVLVKLGKEIARRSEAAEQLGDDEELDVPRILVVCEELNATMKRLASYWRKVKDRDDDNESPAVRAYSDALLMGRAERVHVLAIAQMGTAKALGGGDAREQYGFRALSRFSDQARKMLIPNITGAKSSTHLGRWLVARGETAHDVQFLWMTDVEARTLAMSGRRSVLPFSGAADRVDQAAGGKGGAKLTVIDGGGPGLVTLREASNDEGRGVVPVNLHTLRKHSTRYQDEGFPRPLGVGPGGAGLYHPDHLATFYAERTAGRLVEADA